MEKEIEIGMEKESLIFNNNFKPCNFQEDDFKKNVVLDFSNNQIELITDVHNTPKNVIKDLMSLIEENDNIKYANMWPLSQPAINDYEIKYDGFLDENDLEYRQILINKYPKEMLNISGIHLNINFKLDCTFEEKQNYYFTLMKKIYTYGPLLLQFIGFTPLYENGILDQNLKSIGKNKGFDHSLSLRNSCKHGYFNEHKLHLDYSSLENYKKSIENNIDKKIICSKKEVYSKIRLKETEKKEVYLELRFIDINPFLRSGISIDDLSFLIEAIKVIDKIELLEFDNQNNLNNFEKVALEGLDKTINLKINGKLRSLEEHTKELFDLILKHTDEREIINNKLEKYVNNNLEINKFIKILAENELSILEFGKKFAHKSEQYKDLFPGYNLELSTKILLSTVSEYNLEYSIINEKENAIEIKKGLHIERIIQATKTNQDLYANVEIMSNKNLTKQYLRQNKINVPKGLLLIKNNFKIEDVYNFSKDKKIVIKPVDTNFGLGISILAKNTAQKKINKALEHAFNYSSEILIEEFIEGIEHRFLVINNKVVSIVKREPANIVGDGIHSIEELVTKKNRSQLRGTGYKKPLEEIKLEGIEKDYLKIQKINIQTVLDKDKKIYLRENSNISTGGDSIEEFELVKDYFKDIAIKSAQILGVKICGIDMIIDNENNYTILEANFNPALHIHTYPYKGVGKNPAKDILELLF